MKSKVREEIYRETIERAALMTPQEKIAKAIELSNLCLKMNRAGSLKNRRNSTERRKKKLEKS